MTLLASCSETSWGKSETKLTKKVAYINYIKAEPLAIESQLFHVVP